MPTTTNYGWTTPADTDLVKDGAAAIRTLGSSIDTSVKSLNAGTTAGDLDYYTSSTAKSRIAIGSNGQVLTSNGSVPTWATPSAGGLTLLSTTTLSGATVTISSISQSYKSLFMVISGVTNATADGLFRIAPNGSTNTTTTTQINPSTYAWSLFNNDYLRLSAGFSLLRTDANNAWAVQINNYASTTAYKPILMYGNAQTTSAGPAMNGFGNYQSNTAVSSLVFSNSGGNLSTGTVLLYGVS